MRAGVTVLGSLSIDVITDSSRRLPRLGGVVAYAGLTYRHHGLETAAVFNLAPDNRDLLEPLEDAGLRVCPGPSDRTTVCINHVDGEGRWQEFPAVSRPIEATLAAAAATGARLVHLGPLHPDDFESALPQRLTAPDRVVALDIQGIVRRIEPGRVVGVLSGSAASYLCASDVLKGDRAEVEILSAGLGCPVGELLDRFEIDELLITEGSRGGTIHERSGAEIPFQPPEIVDGDTTGAGDVFFAAYLVERFLRGGDAEPSSRHAARVAADFIGGRVLDRDRLLL